MFIYELFLLSWVLSASPAQGVQLHGTTSFTQAKPIQYLTSFQCLSGTCTYLLELEYAWPSAKLDDSVTLGSSILTNAAWERLTKGSKSLDCQALAQAKKKQLIRLDPAHPHQVVRDFLSRPGRVHAWHFLLDVCHMHKGPSEVYDVQWSLTVQQPSGSHFSGEDFGLLWIEACHFLIYCGLSAILLRNVRLQVYELGRLHLITQFLNLYVGAQLLSSFLSLIHCLVFAWNGQGAALLRVTSSILHTIAQMILSSLLLLIAMGFTLNVGHHAKPLNRNGLAGILVVILFYLCMVFVDEASTKTTPLLNSAERYSGLVHCLIRLIHWALFVLFGRQTYLTSHYSVQHFLRRFLMAGSIYLLSYPILYLATRNFEMRLREHILLNALFVIQSGSLLWLYKLFSRKSQYLSISDFGKSFLPGYVFPFERSSGQFD